MPYVRVWFLCVLFPHMMPYILVWFLCVSVSSHGAIHPSVVLLCFSFLTWCHTSWCGSCMFQFPHMMPYIRFCSCQLNSAALLQKKTETDSRFKEAHKVGSSSFSANFSILAQCGCLPMNSLWEFCGVKFYIICSCWCNPSLISNRNWDPNFWQRGAYGGGG